MQGSNGVTITTGGLRFISCWGSLRYAANTAMAAGLVADSLVDPGGTYSRLASDTMAYILGTNAPQQPHHRGASGVGWEGFQNGLRNEVAIDYNAGFSGALAYLLQQGLG